MKARAVPPRARPRQLHMFTDGSCAGHPCDLCTLCAGGRCCRGDNPDRQLPRPGDWDGPLWGDIGVLAEDADGTHIQCHACGGWFRALPTAHLRRHNLTAEEYKRLFGLEAGHGLVARDVSAALGAGRTWSGRSVRRSTVEQRVVGRLTRGVQPETRRAMAARMRAEHARRAQSRPPGLMSVREAAATLGVPRRTVQYWVERGTLPAVRAGVGRPALIARVMVEQMRAARAEKRDD